LVKVAFFILKNNQMATTLITGATKGIGNALALKFAKEGHDLVLNARTASDLEAFCQALKMEFPSQEFYGFAGDIKDLVVCQNFRTFLLENKIKLDVLINNAGVFRPGAVLEEPSGQLELMIETNLYSAYFMTRATIDIMNGSTKGHIFNMCSIASEIAYPNGGSYSISKFALLGLSKALREELKSTGIRVTSIMPGATWSDSWAGVDLPRQRLIEPESVADMVWGIYQLPKEACVEEFTIRPILGDL
jgi:short-subunit dehydrogenase